MTNTSTVMGTNANELLRTRGIVFLKAIIVTACFGIFLNIIPTYFYYSII